MHRPPPRPSPRPQRFSDVRTVTWFKRRVGDAGENAACKFLRRGGYRILARNYSCPVGEIDIICLHDGTVVFVEVKTLSDDQAADPENNVTPAKQRQVERAARFWLAAHGEPDCAYRFDVVSVVLADRGEPVIRHIVEAFLPLR